jgi:phage baseplate assembly protein W
MPIRKQTIGVAFPFQDSTAGDYLQMNTTVAQEVKSNFVHLLMTTKGERFFLPQFGTNIRQYLFEPQSTDVDNNIRTEISNAIANFMPNIQIKAINITHYGDDASLPPNQQYSITISIDYRVTSGTFDFTDNATLNF